MAAYRRVYDSRHLQADCQEPGSAPESGTLRSVIEHGLPFMVRVGVTALVLMFFYKPPPFTAIVQVNLR